METIPPAPYLHILSKHSPLFEIYLRLWREQDSDSRVSYDREFVRNVICMQWGKFLNVLRSLTKEGLIEFQIEDEDVVHIILATYEI